MEAVTKVWNHVPFPIIVNKPTGSYQSNQDYHYPRLNLNMHLSRMAAEDTWLTLEICLSTWHGHD